MTDEMERVKKLESQAEALTDSLTDLLEGRPISVVVNALGTVAGRFIIKEAELTESQIDQELTLVSRILIHSFRHRVPKTRFARLKYIYHLTQCLTYASLVIDLPEGQ